MRIKSWRVLPYILVVAGIIVFSQIADHSKAQSTNTPPIAVSDTFYVHRYLVTPIGANVLANDSDPDGDPLTANYQSMTYVSGVGFFGLNTNGTPVASGGGVSGTAVITYSITDNRGGQATSTITYHVQNAPPIAAPDYYEIPSTEVFVTPLGEGYLSNDFDPDGDSITTSYQSLTPLPNGAGHYSMDGNGNLTVARSSSYAGVVVIGYQATDVLARSTWGDIILVLPPIDGANNAGRSCPPSGKPVGKPVSVASGNMWLEQADYALPGRGESINVNRFYNSVIQSAGIFGLGWSTDYDESVVAYGDKLLRLNMPDGRAVYFSRRNTSSPYTSTTNNVEGQIIKNGDNSYTLTLKDGRVHDFNPGGRLTRQTDLNGNQTTLAYDTSSRLVSITDAAGRVLTVTPNANGTVNQLSDTMGVVADYEYFTGTTRLKTVTYPDGSKFKFEYDTTSASGKVLLKTVKDAYDNILETHLYDSSARATTSEVHGGQEKFEFNYSYWTGSTPYTLVKHKKNAADPYTETKYYFDKKRSMNVVTKSEGVCGCGGSGSEVTQFQYDARLNLVKKTDALLNQTTYAYDANNNLIALTDTLGTQRWTYNSLGQVLTYKDRVHQSTSNNTAAMTYDSAGNLLTSTDALGNVTTLTYTTAGQPASVTDARSNSTTFTYDTQGRLIEVTDANSKDTTFAYDARARLTSTTNARSETTTFEYDLNNRLKRVIFPDANYVEHTYDLAGRRTATRDPRGNSTTYAYDNAYRLTSVTDPLSHARTFGYDLMSNLVSQTDALGNTTNFEYDDFNRLKKVIYPAASVGATRLEESTTYDKLGNVKTRVDTAGRTTSYLYDTSNRLTKITDALTNQTNFEYNLRSQLTKVKDALNQEYVFTYDPLGRTLSQTRAGTTMSFEYDQVGNRTKRTDYSGRVTNYEYDNLNRLTTLMHGTIPESTYTYDDLSRLLTATNGAGTVTFSYDNRGRVESETDVFGRVLEYGYDANGNRTSLELDGNTHTTYAYDVANRLTTLTDDSSQSYTYGYDIADRLISKALPNGITTTYDYDGMSRLTRLKDSTVGSTLLDRVYSYNTANQISAITEPSRTRTFGNDNINRLTSATDSALGAESYAFDAVGNRTSSHLSASYTTDPFNRTTAATGIAQTFDSNGNTATRTAGGTAWTLSWDRENRLTQASSAGATVDYVYDALGRRVRRTEGSTDTKFTHDGQDVVLDDDPVSGIVKYQNAPWIDNKLSFKHGATTSYFLADHLGSTDALTDASGAISASQTYDSFGNGSNGSFPSRYQFTGREYDPTIGIQFSRARFYDPKLGRFISEDPIGFAGGDINLYGYVWNSPRTYRDPTGQIPVPVFVYATFEISATSYDVYDFGATIMDECSDAWDIGLSGGGLILGTVAPVGGYGAVLKGLRRPYIRKATREAAEKAARRDPRTGAFLDYNTGIPIPNDKYDLGHRYGKEYWRLKDQATRDGLTQREFNDLLNDPDLYRIEHPRINRSHEFEMP